MKGIHVLNIKLGTYPCVGVEAAVRVSWGLKNKNVKG